MMIKSAFFMQILSLFLGASAAAGSAPIAWSDIGAKAGAQYYGDALNVSATGDSAHLTCGFQNMEGTVTGEWLWLTSTTGAPVTMCEGATLDIRTAVGWHTVLEPGAYDPHRGRCHGQCDVSGAHLR